MINIFVETIKDEEKSIFKEIICPKCKESSKIEIKDYIINLYNCKNRHKIKNILFNEFEKKQNIDISKNICNICYKKNINNNKLYRCCTCQFNICLICKIKHEKTHKITDYDNKNCICNKHDEIYSKYCNLCKENICKLCENMHLNHDQKNFEEIIPNKNNVKKRMLKLRKSIDKLNKIIKDIIQKLINIMDNNEAYYKII